MINYNRRHLAYYLDRKPDTVNYYIEKAKIKPQFTVGFNSEKFYNIYQFEYIIREYFKSKALCENRKNQKPYNVVKAEVTETEIFLYYNSKINKK